MSPEKQGHIFDEEARLPKWRVSDQLLGEVVCAYIHTYILYLFVYTGQNLKLKKID